MDCVSATDSRYEYAHYTSTGPHSMACTGLSADLSSERPMCPEQHGPQAQAHAGRLRLYMYLNYVCQLCYC